MEKMILSLKNIYMLLMTEDFPIYSESVIGRNDRRGLTMLRFWQGQIVEQFRCLPCGKMLWRNDGKRNRYTSYLCNRSAEIKTYSDYARELACQISPSSLTDQTERFMDFLSARNYRHDTLLRRVRELVRLTEAEDPRVSRPIADQLREAADWQPGGVQGALFQAAYLLTLLTLYAAAGEAMDDPVMAVLRAGEFGIGEMWRCRTRRPETKSAAAVFLTAHSGLLQDNPLPSHRFFGREEELFNLKEIAASGRKCLISGMGGMGKTELLRQLIHVCESEKIVDKIAVVPYEGSIAESVARCFPEYQRQNQEESFHAALYHLQRESEQGKVLLLIDNLTNGPEEDPNLEQLNGLSCGILITSRRASLAGFETCSLNPPTVGTGALIFRDNLGRPLSREDRTALEGLLLDDTLCHPLTLRLMARAARSKGWTVAELKGQLADTSLSWQEEERTVRLSQVYRQLYSCLRIPEECQQLAELFTLLPRDSYCLEFLREWFPCPADEHSEEKLDALVSGGWLDRDGSGYAMHPLIAQCLRRKVISEDRIRPMFQTVQTRLLEIEYQDLSQPTDPGMRRIRDIVDYVCRFLTGSISRDWMDAVLTALCLHAKTKQSNDRQLKMLGQLMRRCPEQDDRTELLYLTALGYRRCGEEARFDAVYCRQKENLTVPRRTFLDFCLYAGESLTYMGAYSKAQTYIREALCAEAAPFQKANAFYYLSMCCEQSGDSEKSLDWLQQGASFAAQTPQCGKYITFRLLAVLCQEYVKYGRKEQAAAVLRQIEAQDLVRDTPDDRSQYAFMAGLYEMKFGDPEKALAFTRESMGYAEAFEGRNVNYFLHVGQIAGILRAMERYEEALAVYKDLLTEVKKLGSPQLINLYSTNISTVYLRLNQPEEALEHLETALVFAREKGGLPLAVGLRNRARAFRLLEDPEQEFACLREAVPLLEETYGPDHPETAAARERLEELKGRHPEAGPSAQPGASV